MINELNITELLKKTVEIDASDLHLTVGQPPMVRVYGTLQPLEYPKLDSENIKSLVYSILDKRQQEEIEKEWELDFSHSVPGLSRFREIGRAHV